MVLRSWVVSMVSFFFQAEGGIRDLTVTGVQTCALPILIRVMTMAAGAVPSSRVLWKKPDQPELPLADGKTRTLPTKDTPCRACLGSMIRPAAGSMPPQPEMGSGETRASPSA